MNVDMSELGIEDRGSFCEKANHLLVIAGNDRIVVRVKADSGEESLPLKNFFCCMKEGKEFGFSTRGSDSLLFCRFPINWSSEKLK